MPELRRRDVRRWRERRVLRRRRAKLVGAAAVLVGALAFVLTAAPGAHAPTREDVMAALTSGADRARDVASRAGERAPDVTPRPAPSPAAAAPSPAGSDLPADVPPAPVPSAAAAPAPAAPAPAAPEPEPAPVDDAGAAMSEQIVVLTNAERASAGVPELGVSSCATEHAAARAALLVAEGRFEHDPLGPVLEGCAARTVGENLSLGYATASAAVVGWMGSPGHRENILRGAYGQLGVACAQGGRGWLCVQVFVG